MALYPLTHLVVNDVHFAPTGAPVATQFLSTMAKNGFLTGNKWVTKPLIQ